MEVECEVLLSVPGLTGCLGQCEGRRRAGSPPECQQWSHRRSRERTAHRAPPGCCAGSSGGGEHIVFRDLSVPSGCYISVTTSALVLHTVQMPVSGWQESEWPLHSQSSQWPRYKPPPVRVYPAAQSWKIHYDFDNETSIRRSSHEMLPAERFSTNHYLARESLVSRWAAALLHLEGLSQATVVRHRNFHADIKDAGGPHLSGVGCSNQDVIQISQDHHQVLSGGGHAIGTTPIFLINEMKAYRWIWGIFKDPCVGFYSF